MQYSSSIHKKRIIFLTAAAYILAALAIFASSFAVIQNRAVSRTREYMKQALYGISSEIKLKMDRDAIYTRSLAVSNSVLQPLILGMYYQIKDNCNKLIDGNGFKGLVVTDSNSGIIYDNRVLFNGKADYVIKEKESNYYFIKDNFYIISYFPLMDGTHLWGSISPVYSIEDFSSIISSNLKNTSCVFMPIYNGQAIASAGKDGKFKHEAGERMKYTYYLELTSSKSDMISGIISEKPVPNGAEFAIGFPFPAYRAMTWESAKYVLLITFLLLLALTLAVLTVFHVIKRYRTSRIELKSEIERLRIQRHDYIKHINIVNALAASDEKEELGKYVYSLNEETSTKSGLNDSNAGQKQ